MDIILGIAAALAGAALTIIVSRFIRDFLRLRQETRMLERDLAKLEGDGTGMHKNGAIAESVTIEVTTPAGLVLLPLRADDPESIGRFLREAEKARGEPAYATR